MKDPAGTALKATALFFAAAILIGVPSFVLQGVWNETVDGTIVASEPVEHGSRYVLKGKAGDVFERGGGGSGLASDLKVGSRVFKEPGSFQYWVDGAGTKGSWPPDFIPIIVGVFILIGGLVTILRSK